MDAADRRAGGGVPHASLPQALSPDAVPWLVPAVLLGIVAASCLGVGMHIGVQVAFSQIAQLGQLHAAELRELRLLHQAERADLTGKLAEVAKANCRCPDVNKTP